MPKGMYLEQNTIKHRIESMYIDLKTGLVYSDREMKKRIGEIDLNSNNLTIKRL